MKPLKWIALSFTFLISVNLLAFQEDYLHPFPQWDVPYVPTPHEVVTVMLEIGQVGPNDLLYDLGCGDGRIVITAAKRYGTKGVGIDIDPERIAECRTNAAAEKVENLVRFLNQDLFKTDFSEASVVTLYLLSSVNLKLRPKIFSELRPGTRIVSHDFSMGEWQADKKDELFVQYKNHYIYFWVVPANVSGEWKLSLPKDISSRPAKFLIQQEFQKIQVQTNSPRSRLVISDAELEGEKITFTLEHHGGNGIEAWTLEGAVNGHIIEGEVRSTPNITKSGLKWKAERDPRTIRPIDPKYSKD
jgi:SAM-dependent methyltransferase